jgi:peptide/nickel transport system substrate-binding protein
MLAAAIGNPTYYKECYSVFPCGTPLASEAGKELAYPASKDEARQILRQSGYAGERLVILQPTDVPIANAFALVVAKTCRDIGMTVDLQAMDWSSITSRRNKRDPVDQGGWNLFASWWIGGDILNPISNLPLIADPERGWTGWPADPRLEELRAAFAAADTLEKQKQAAAAVQQRALEIATSVNLGTFFIPVGYRDTISGMIPSPIAFFWNIEKRA